MDQIGPEHSQFSALELEEMPYLIFYTLASANIDQLAPRFRMSLTMGTIGPEQPELFALEFLKIVEFNYVYTLDSTNIIQSAPNLVTIILP